MFAARAVNAGTQTVEVVVVVLIRYWRGVTFGVVHGLWYLGREIRAQGIGARGGLYCEIRSAVKAGRKTCWTSGYCTIKVKGKCDCSWAEQAQQ